MNIKYFTDTDTALIEFSEGKIAETMELSENIYIDVDDKGNVISMTVEHARKQLDLPNISFKEILPVSA